MSFDQSTRNRLQKFVSTARELLSDETTRQLQATYGMDPKTGTVADMDSLSHLDNRQSQTAITLRETLTYYLTNTAGKSEQECIKQALQRIVREQAFTVLNRLAALRMAESRGFLIESVSNGYNSKGFQLYKQLAGSSQGATGDAYCNYLFSLFDEFSLDLAVLFDRHSIQGLLFPGESALLELLKQINHHDIEILWAEDETIGWIYQYYNDPYERKKMRKESAAPRNSRELAVRNQFFTPRYVVEFLTDNTLGRVWYEMTQGETRLKDECRYLVRRPTEIFLSEGEAAPETLDQEGLSQEDLLKQPVYIPHRPIKDPRDIRLLDPACGSMHFGLYAFDLLEIIYEESWDNGNSPALQEAYPSKDEFLKDIPRLIIEHNIHGIDIDPRAVQIAGLSLWLRAQKTWQARDVKPADRPQVRRSNIVCAEPMPGNPEMLEDFVATLDPPLLGELVQTVFDKMQLAGEAGSLLKIEEEIQTAIEDARKQSRSQQGDLFEQSMATDESFFDTAEHRVIDALRDYSEQAVSESYQRRLFADDAARGFAFIDLCRKRYDAVVMNPPFGQFSEDTFKWAESFYRGGHNDIYAAFVIRAIDLLSGSGLAGGISSNSFIRGKSLETLRVKWLQESLVVCADLGLDVMDDAWVESATYVLEPGSLLREILFFDLREKSSKEQPLGEAIDRLLQGSASAKIRIRGAFAHMPRNSFLYDLSISEMAVMASGEEFFDPSVCSARSGLRTFENERFVRLWWESASENIGLHKTWNFFSKGGEFELFYQPLTLLVKWNESGEELMEKNRNVNGQIAQARQGSTLYFKSGLTFPSRSELGFCARVFPADAIFSSNGPAIIPHQGVNQTFLTGLLSSAQIRGIINLQSHRRSYSPGLLRRVPWLKPSQSIEDGVSRSAQKAILAKAEIFARDETMPLFAGRSDLSNLSDSFLSAAVESDCRAFKRTSEVMEEALREIDEGLSALYGPAEPDNYSDALVRTSATWSSEEEDPCSQLFHFGLGTAFGRWDIRYATGDRQPPGLPDPFDPLPVCPPGMLQNTEGLPAAQSDVPADYPLRISWPGILLDDENHPEDIVARVREAIKVIWKDRADVIEQEACEILGVKKLRDYFRRPAAFFADHLKRYSKSRRQAPIYWPLSTQSGSYTLWLYYHRLSNQTLYTCINDFIEPKLINVADDLGTLRGKSARSSLEEKELAKLTDLEIELKDFREELLRIAKFWKPNLNDGVQITAAPLWALFQLKHWQKKLKTTWANLEKGDYDWAHLAYSIWPDRVLRKCHKDRSLAIAHDVESDLWEEVEASGSGGRGTKLVWQPKQMTEAELDLYIQQKVSQG